MKRIYNRRKFIASATVAALGIGIAEAAADMGLNSIKKVIAQDRRVGIIGLDTSHSIAFAKALNDPSAAPEFMGYKVVAAFPKGSSDIKSSVDRIPGYTEDIKKMGVEIVGSIEELLTKVDVVLLETNDGRLHLQQALPVLKAGKRLFIDKPVAASFADAIAIYDASKKYNVPIFSSSSLRYTKGAQDIALGKTVSKVMGADTYSPCTLEKTHPDLFWYGIHGVELLFTVMGTGCRSVVRIHTSDTDTVVGTWADNRIGTFRGMRSGKSDYGGTVFGDKAVVQIGSYEGYNPLLLKITEFFHTGNPPVSAEETLEIYAFMEAADESKRRGCTPVSLDEVYKKAKALPRITRIRTD
jgi:Oxidoreductase family, NAD-binding Rossmann fold